MFFRRKTRSTDLLLMLTAVVLANINPIFAKLILASGWSPVQMYFVALLVMTIILLLYQIMKMEQGESWGMKKHDLLGTMIAAVTGGTLAPILFFEGLQTVSASTSIILTSLLPLFVVVFAVLLLRERFTAQMVVGGLFLLSAMAALLWEEILQFEVGPGIPMIVGSSLLSALTIIIHKKLVRNRHIDSVVLVRTLISTTLVGAWLVFTDGKNFAFLMHPQNVWLVLALPVVSFLIPFFLYFRALRTLKARDAGVMEALGRIVGIIAAASILGESLEISHFISLLLAVFGVILISVPLTKWRIVPSRLPEMGPLRK